MEVAVIGAGWAGCAAAVTLARLGHRVAIFEQGIIPGGRARRVQRTGLALDNGQHLLLGAYVQTRNVLAVVHGGDGERGLVRKPLRVAPLADSPGALRLRAWRLPAPLGLLAGLLSANGLSARERLSVIAWFARVKRSGFRCDPGTTAAALLAHGPPAAARALWGPLCLAALNTPPERACGQVFANVLAAAFDQHTDDSDFLFAATDLSALFPEPAIRRVEALGGRASLRTTARIASIDATNVTIATGTRHERFDAAVVAVGPHQIEGAVPKHALFDDVRRTAGALAYEPIATVWLGYTARTPLPGAITRLDDAPGQWLFDRPEVLARAQPDERRPSLAQLVGVVISASGPHDTMAGDALARACDAQLRRLVPGWPPLAWSQTITERRATYACTPGRVLPASLQPHPRVAFAGDWLDSEFPATIEAAVRSGVAAASALDQRVA